MVFHNNDNKIRKEDRNSELSQNGRLLPYETLSSSWYCLLFFKAIFRVFFFFFFVNPSSRPLGLVEPVAR